VWNLPHTSHGDEGQALAVDGLEPGNLSVELPRLLVYHSLEFYLIEPCQKHDY